MGDLIRVLPGFFQDRHEDIISLVNGPSKFVTFVPLASLIKGKICSLIANKSIPLSEQKFPQFRAGAVNSSTKKVDNWWLWDGVKEWKVGQLSKEERKLPIRGIWNDTLLIERIASEWSPENDPS